MIHITHGKYDYLLNSRKSINKGKYSSIFFGEIKINSAMYNSNHTCKNTNNYIAIKKINNKYNNVLCREIDTIKFFIENRLSHTNVVNYFDYVVSNNMTYIMMEYCINGTLSSLLVRPIKDCYAKYYFKQLLEGIRFIHTNGITHSDINPDNILITNDYKTLKLCDFSFSLSENNSNHTLINTIKLRESLMYMDPVLLSHHISHNISNNILDYSEKSFSLEEDINYNDNDNDNNNSNHNTHDSMKTNIFQIQKNNMIFDLSMKADIWSIGIILYEMLYGYHPYNKIVESSIMYAIKRIDYANIKNIYINNDAIKLLRNILSVDNNLRANLDSIMLNTWVKCSTDVLFYDEIKLSDLFNRDLKQDKNVILINNNNHNLNQRSNNLNQRSKRDIYREFKNLRKINNSI